MPDELTEGFKRLGLRGGDSVLMHASLESMGVVDGGSAMILHRLLGILGKEGTLLMPTFTSIARHSINHENFTKPGCWCEGREERHVPFIPELQPDKNIGNIAQRLCSWPASQRSKHPAYSFVAVGKRLDELVRAYSLDDPLLPVRKLQKHDSLVLTIGVNLDQATAIHVAGQRKLKEKYVRERALTVTSKGKSWVEITTLGCSNGFESLRSHVGDKDSKETKIGLANANTYSLNRLIDAANALLDEDPRALLCNNSACLSCAMAK